MSFIETERLSPATYARIDRRSSRDRLFDGVAAAILVAVACVIALTFRDYSLSTDEEVQNTYGRLLLDFYLSGLTDTRAFDYGNLYLYGGLFDLLAAAIAPFSPLPDFETRHLLCATFGVLGIVATWRLARLLAGPRAGLLAVVLLVLCPVDDGAMFNNTKDIPFAAAMTWMLYLSCRLVTSLRRPPLPLMAWLGVAAGASLGIRVGAALGGLYLIPVLLWRVIETGRRCGLRVSVGATVGLMPRLLLAIVIALSLMALLWPWSVMAPDNILIAVHDLTAFHVPTVFAGHQYDSYDVSALYLPTYYALKLPEILLGIASSVVSLGVAVQKRQFGRSAPLWLLIALAASVPAGYAIITKPALYHGLRHFLFTISPLCILAAAGLDRAIVASRRLGEPALIVLALILITAAGKDVWTMVALHPHQYVYYNLLAGGVRGADGRYEMDYWENFAQEAMTRLLGYIKEENGGQVPDRPFVIDICTSPWSVRAYGPSNFIVADACRADFFMATTNAGCADACPGKTIIKVERMGVVLGVVKDRRDAKADEIGGRTAATR